MPVDAAHDDEVRSKAHARFYQQGLRNARPEVDHFVADLRYEPLEEDQVPGMSV
jgi:hypothetical protein